MYKQNKHSLKYMKEIRKGLRNNASPAEQKLWYYLRRQQQLGKKFRRQHSYKGYVIDFYCYELKLGIELDGAYHFQPIGQINDMIRTEVLEKADIRIIRFENELVFHHTEMVLAQIREAIKQKMRDG